MEPCHVSEGSQEEFLALEFLRSGYLWPNRASNQPAPAQGLYFSHMGGMSGRQHVTLLSPTVHPDQGCVEGCQQGGREESPLT